MDLTKPQQKALVSLLILRSKSRAAGFSRWAMGRISRQDFGSYPIKTLRALQRNGFVRPVNDEAVELVETGECRCGCDLWFATVQGHAHVLELNVVVPRHG